MSAKLSQRAVLTAAVRPVQWPMAVEGAPKGHVEYLQRDPIAAQEQPIRHQGKLQAGPTDAKRGRKLLASLQRGRLWDVLLSDATAKMPWLDALLRTLGFLFSLPIAAHASIRFIEGGLVHAQSAVNDLAKVG